MSVALGLTTLCAVAEDRPFELYARNHQSAVIAQDVGNYAAAERWHRKNLELVDTNPQAPPFTKVQARYYLANAMVLQGRLDDAEGVLTQAQALVDANPATHPIIRAHLQSNWGGLRVRQQQPKVAVEHLESALALMKSATVPADLLFATTKVELGRALARLGETAEAEKSYADALKAFANEGVTDSNPYVGDSIMEYKRLRKRLGLSD